jgi:protein SCO1
VRNRRTIRRAFIVAAAFIVPTAALPVFAHGGHHRAADSSVVEKKTDSILLPASLKDTSARGTMGWDEHPGAVVPLDVPFVDEKGDTIALRTLVKGPTVLALLYYGCQDACNTLITGIGNALRPFTGDTATAPRVVCISIAAGETSADARKAREIGFESIQKPYPADRWRFLTGSAASVSRVADAVGFRYIKKGDDYDHPLGLVVLSPRGKVMRYILGTDYLPMDLSMSLMEAENGVVQPTIARVLRACFSYDPKGRRYVFNILQVSATVIFTLLGIFIVYLIVSGRKRAKGNRR